MTRALLYLRQSDSEGEGEHSLSLDSQNTVLRADAAKLGWTIVAEVRDPDLKGYDENRPGLLELYDRCRDGSVDLVAFWRLDRFARKLRLQENVVHELSQLGVGLYSNQEPWIGEPFFRQVLGAHNEHMTRVISANVRSALLERARRGIWNGTPPLGYATAGDRPLVIAEPGARTVRQIFALRRAGLTRRQIAQRLTAEEVPTANGAAGWSYTMVGRVLENEAYLGVLRHGGVVVHDAHPPLIDRETWDATRGTLGAEGRARAPRLKAVGSWLEGQIIHECGRPMYLIASRSSRGHPYRCFRCRYASRHMEEAHRPGCEITPRNLAVARAEALAWEAIRAALADLLDPETIYAEALAAFRRDAPGAEVARRAAERRKARAAQKRRNAELLFTSGRRDLAWFDAEDAAASAAIAEAERALAALPAQPDQAAIAAAWAELRELEAVLGRFDADGRAAVLRTLGVAVVGPAGIPAGQGGRGDRGAVTLRWHPVWRRLLGVGP